MSSSLSSRKKKNYSVRALVPENEEDGPCDAMAQRRSPEPLMDPTAMDAVTDGGVATPQPLLGVPQAVPADSSGGEPAGYILEQPGIRNPCPGATPSEPSRIHGRSPPADQQQELPNFFGQHPLPMENSARQPRSMSPDDPKCSLSKLITSHLDAQTLAAALHGDTICLLSGVAAADRSSSTPRKTSRGLRNGPVQNASSLELRTHSVDVRVKADFSSASRANTATAPSTGDRSISGRVSTIEIPSDETFEATRSIDESSESEAPTRAKVSVEDKTSRDGGRITSSVRAAISTAFRPSQKRDLSVEATYRRTTRHEVARHTLPLGMAVPTPAAAADLIHAPVAIHSTSASRVTATETQPVSTAETGGVEILSTHSHTAAAVADASAPTVETSQTVTGPGKAGPVAMIHGHASESLKPVETATLSPEVSAIAPPHVSAMGMTTSKHEDEFPGASTASTASPKLTSIIQESSGRLMAATPATEVPGVPAVSSTSPQERLSGEPENTTSALPGTATAASPIFPPPTYAIVKTPPKHGADVPGASAASAAPPKITSLSRESSALTMVATPASKVLGVPAVTATGPETASLVRLEPDLQTGKPVSTAAGVPVAESQVPVSMAVVPKPQVSIANAPYTTAKSNEGIPVTPAAGIAPEAAEARVPSRDSAPAVETLSAPPIRKPSLTVPISAPRSATQKSKTSVQEKGPSARLIPDQQATPDMVNTSSEPPLSTSSLDRHPSTCAVMQGGPKLVPSTPNTLSEQVVPPILLGTRRRSSTCKVLSFAQAATEPPTPIPTVSPPLTPGVSSVAPLPPSPMVINAPDNGPEIPSASSAGALQPEKKAEDSVAGVRSPQTKEGLHGPVVSPVPDYGYSAGRGFPGYREDPSNWRFPGAGARPGVSPSAVAPTPAAPSAAVFGSSKMATARQVAAFPGAYIRQQSSWNMPLSPEALDTHTAAGELQPADDTTPETETAQRQPDSLFSTSYTRLTWSTVTIPSAPFTFASSSIIGSVDAKTEPHHQVAEDSFQNGQAPIALAALTEAPKRSAVTTTVDKPQATTKGMAPRVAATAVIAPTVDKKPPTTTMITAEAAKPPVPTNAVASVVAGKAVTGPTMGKRPSTTTLATAKAAKPQATTKEVVSTVVGKAVSGPTIGRRPSTTTSNTAEAAKLPVQTKLAPNVAGAAVSLPTVVKQASTTSLSTAQAAKPLPPAKAEAATVAPTPVSRPGVCKRPSVTSLKTAEAAQPPVQIKVAPTVAGAAVTVPTVVRQASTTSLSTAQAAKPPPPVKAGTATVTPTPVSVPTVSKRPSVTSLKTAEAVKPPVQTKAAPTVAGAAVTVPTVVKQASTTSLSTAQAAKPPPPVKAGTATVTPTPVSVPTVSKRPSVTSLKTAEAAKPPVQTKVAPTVAGAAVTVPTVVKQASTTSLTTVQAAKTPPPTKAGAAIVAPTPVSGPAVDKRPSVTSLKTAEAAKPPVQTKVVPRVPGAAVTAHTVVKQASTTTLTRVQPATPLPPAKAGAATATPTPVSGPAVSQRPSVTSLKTAEAAKPTVQTKVAPTVAGAAVTVPTVVKQASTTRLTTVQAAPPSPPAKAGAVTVATTPAVSKRPSVTSLKAAEAAKPAVQTKVAPTVAGAAVTAPTVVKQASTTSLTTLQAAPPPIPGKAAAATATPTPVSGPAVSKRPSVTSLKTAEAAKPTVQTKVAPTVAGAPVTVPTVVKQASTTSLSTAQAAKPPPPVKAGTATVTPTPVSVPTVSKRPSVTSLKTAEAAKPPVQTKVAPTVAGAAVTVPTVVKQASTTSLTTVQAAKTPPPTKAGAATLAPTPVSGPAVDKRPSVTSLKTAEAAKPTVQTKVAPTVAGAAVTVPTVVKQASTTSLTTVQAAPPPPPAKAGAVTVATTPAVSKRPSVTSLKTAEAAKPAVQTKVAPTVAGAAVTAPTVVKQASTASLTTVRAAPPPIRAKAGAATVAPTPVSGPAVSKRPSVTSLKTPEAAKPLVQTKVPPTAAGAAVTAPTVVKQASTTSFTTVQAATPPPPAKAMAATVAPTPLSGPAVGKRPSVTSFTTAEAAKPPVQTKVAPAVPGAAVTAPTVVKQASTTCLTPVQAATPPPPAKAGAATATPTPVSGPAVSKRPSVTSLKTAEAAKPPVQTKVAPGVPGAVGTAPTVVKQASTTSLTTVQRATPPPPAKAGAATVTPTPVSGPAVSKRPSVTSLKTAEAAKPPVQTKVAPAVPGAAVTAPTVVKQASTTSLTKVQPATPPPPAKAGAATDTPTPVSGPAVSKRPSVTSLKTGEAAKPPVQTKVAPAVPGAAVTAPTVVKQASKTSLTKVQPATPPPPAKAGAAAVTPTPVSGPAVSKRPSVTSLKTAETAKPAVQTKVAPTVAGAAVTAPTVVQPAAPPPPAKAGVATVTATPVSGPAVSKQPSVTCFKTAEAAKPAVQTKVAPTVAGAAVTAPTFVKQASTSLTPVQQAPPPPPAKAGAATATPTPVSGPAVSKRPSVTSLKTAETAKPAVQTKLAPTVAGAAVTAPTVVQPATHLPPAKAGAATVTPTPVSGPAVSKRPSVTSLKTADAAKPAVQTKVAPTVAGAAVTAPTVVKQASTTSLTPVQAATPPPPAKAGAATVTPTPVSGPAVSKRPSVTSLKTAEAAKPAVQTKVAPTVAGAAVTAPTVVKQASTTSLTPVQAATPPPPAKAGAATVTPTPVSGPAVSKRPSVTSLKTAEAAKPAVQTKVAPTVGGAAVTAPTVVKQASTTSLTPVQPATPPPPAKAGAATVTPTPVSGPAVSKQPSVTSLKTAEAAKPPVQTKVAPTYLGAAVTAPTVVKQASTTSLTTVQAAPPPIPAKAGAATVATTPVSGPAVGKRPSVTSLKTAEAAKPLVQTKLAPTVAGGAVTAPIVVKQASTTSLTTAQAAPPAIPAKAGAATVVPTPVSGPAVSKRPSMTSLKTPEVAKPPVQTKVPPTAAGAAVTAPTVVKQASTTSFTTVQAATPLPTAKAMATTVAPTPVSGPAVGKRPSVTSLTTAEAAKPPVQTKVAPTAAGAAVTAPTVVKQASTTRLTTVQAAAPPPPAKARAATVAPTPVSGPAVSKRPSVKSLKTPEAAKPPVQTKEVAPTVAGAAVTVPTVVKEASTKMLIKAQATKHLPPAKAGAATVAPKAVTGPTVSKRLSPASLKKAQAAKPPVQTRLAPVVAGAAVTAPTVVKQASTSLITAQAAKPPAPAKAVDATVAPTPVSGPEVGKRPSVTSLKTAEAAKPPVQSKEVAPTVAGAAVTVPTIVKRASTTSFSTAQAAKPPLPAKGRAAMVAPTAFSGPIVEKRPSVTSLKTTEAAKPPVQAKERASMVAGASVTVPTVVKRASATSSSTAGAAEPPLPAKEGAATVAPTPVSGPVTAISRTVVSKRPSAADLRSTTLHMRPGDTPDAAAASGSEESKLRLATSHAVETFKEQREELDDGKAQVGVQPLLAWCKKRPKGKISLVVQAPPSAQGSNLSLKLKPGTAKGERRLSNISQASKFKMNTDRLKTSTSKHATSNITAVKGTSVGRAHRRESSLTGENRKISARTSDIQYEKSELFNSNTKQTSASLIKRRFSKLPSITSANQASAAAPRIASSFSASSSEKPNLQNSQIDVGGGKDSTSFKTAELPKYQLVLAGARKLCRNKILLEVESPLTKKPTSHSKEIIDKRQQEVFSTAPTRHEVSERMSLGRKPSDSSTLNSQARKNSITRTRDVSARSAKALAATAVKKNARKTTSATSAENKKSEPHKQKRSFQETKSSNRAAAYPVFLTQDKYSALHMAGGGGESPVGIVAMGPFRRSLGLAQLNDTESEGDATSQLVFTVSPSSPPAVSVREGLGTPTEIFQLAPCTESDQPPDCDPPSLASSVFEKRKKAKKHKVKDVGNNAPPEGSEGEPLQLPRVTSRYVQANLETSGEGHAEAALRDEDTPSVLIASTLFLVAVVLALLIALTYLQATVTPPSETQPIPSPPAASAIVYCSSEFCDREAEYIKSLLGARGTDACENFYEYVCTAWSQSHPAGGSIGTGAAVSSDTIIQDRLVHMLASFLPSNRAEDISVAVPLFNACTDRKKAYAATRDIKELLKRWRIGQWPRDAPGTIKDVWVFAGELLRDLGLVSLIELEVVASLENPDHTFIELRKPSLLFAGNDVYRSSVKTLFQLALRDAASEFTQATKAEILGEVMQVFIRFSSAPLELGSTEIDVDKFPGLVAATVNQSELDVDIKDFLYISFDNATILNPERVLMIKPVKYVRDFLAKAMREVVPRALLNYIGFLVIVHFSPFLPEQQVNLRQLFAKSFLGRTLPHVTNSSALCMIAVERAVPTCFSKLSMNIFKDLEYDLHVPEKLSQLEKAFARNIRHLAWMNDELALLKRYRIKRGRASQFGPAAAAGYNSSCPHSQRPPTMGSPVHYYHSVSRQQQRSRLQRALSGRAAVTESGSNFRPSSVRASYDRLLHRVLVPAALFNTSVPVNSVGFSLQLARYAVRFYHALLDSMFLVDLDPGYWGGDAPRRRLEGLLECFEEDLRLLPARLRGQVAPDSALSRAAVLQQTVALQLAFRAFQELWQVRRSWKQDFRYQRLPQLSSDALFFVYYALDNCESSDVVYKEHAGHWLPADYRVNLPLRHLVEFASLFNCSAETSMGRMISGHTCNVVTPDTWSGLAPRNT